MATSATAWTSTNGAVSTSVPVHRITVFSKNAIAVTVRKRLPATVCAADDRKTQACCRPYETAMLATNPAVDATTGRTCMPSASSRPTPKWVSALAPPLIPYRTSRPRSALGTVDPLTDHPLFGHRVFGRRPGLLLYQIARPAADLLVDPGQILPDHAQPEQDE